MSLPHARLCAVFAMFIFGAALLHGQAFANAKSALELFFSDSF